MSIKNKPQSIRCTVPVNSEVHQVFQRFAAAAGMSVGRAMGEWLADTVEGAAFVAEKMERARAAPSQVVRELHAFSLGMTDEAVSLLTKLQKDGQKAAGAAGDASAAPEAPGDPLPPLSNTGGKPTNKTKNPKGKP